MRGKFRAFARLAKIIRTSATSQPIANFFSAAPPLQMPFPATPRISLKTSAIYLPTA
jgi:hypothetical protein